MREREGLLTRSIEPFHGLKASVDALNLLKEVNALPQVHIVQRLHLTL